MASLLQVVAKVACGKAGILDRHDLCYLVQIASF